MNNALFVGIDVSSKNNVAYIMKPNGDKHSSFSIPNNRPGAEILVDRIVEVLRRLFIPKVVIGMESTSVYGDNLMYFLRETGKFSGFEKKLHMLNPKQVKKFRDTYSDLPKNDFVDAFIIKKSGLLCNAKKHLIFVKNAYSLLILNMLKYNAKKVAVMI